MNLWRRVTPPVLIYRALTQQVAKRTVCYNVNKLVNITSPVANSHQQTIYSCSRYKSTKKQYDSDDEQDVIVDDDNSLSKDSKVVKFSTTSMRADAILKSALGISRNKVEQAFYESKIRVNGKKIMKKSASVRLGDEVDIVKMVSPKNSEHLYVSRIEILNIAPKDDSISISARRFKNLLIENYEDDPYKGSSESDA